MVFKKPYAFLIKHFKLIHLILGILTAYLTYKTTALVGFFREYASTGIIPYANNLASNYINFFMYGATVLVLIITIIVYILLHRKEKKTTIYAVTVGYYLALFILLTVGFNILGTIERELIKTETIRLYRDLSLIVYLPQYFFLLFTLFRGIGFDIKKFNFSEDLNKMEIEERDAEEVEVVVPKNTYKIERVIRRFIREFNYYVKENTFIFICICVFIIIGITTAIFMNMKVYNEKIKVGEPFVYKGFTLTNLDSIVTNMDIDGEILVKDKYYLIVTFNVKVNRGGELNKDDFRLLVGKDIHYPIYNKKEHFIDCGTPYGGEKLLAGMNKDYIFVFELEKNMVLNSYQLRIVNNLTFNVGEIIPSYKDLILKPTRIDKIKKDGNFKLNEKIDFKKSNLKNSSLIVKSYSITDSYIYKYEYCDNLNRCTPMQMPIHTDSGKKTLLVLDYDLVMEDSYYKESLRNKSDRYMFFSFAKIRYEVNGKEKITKPIDRKKTPENYTDIVLMEVDSEIMQAAKIDLLLRIRNHEYAVTLK